MDALIFDFDGVLVDSEPVHMAGFAKVVKPLGISFTQQQYLENYLGLDDYDGLALMLRQHNLTLPQERINQLVAAKTAYLQRHLRKMPAMEGVVKLVQDTRKAAMPLAICSGALREEVPIGVASIGLENCFDVIIAAEDMPKGKPSPDGYLKAVAELARLYNRNIDPRRCVAIEDSPTGIKSAKAAGMAVLGLTSTFPGEKLTHADKIVNSLNDISLADLAAMIND